MAKIHIIGANRYVGALLVNYLAVEGHNVDIASYRLPDIRPESIDADIVIHLASYGGGSKHKLRDGWQDYAQMQKININGMKTLLSGLVNKSTKIIFLFSSAVYGKFLEPSLLDEQAVLKPVSEYGRQKAEAVSTAAQSNGRVRLAS